MPYPLFVLFSAHLELNVRLGTTLVRKRSLPRKQEAMQSKSAEKGFCVRQYGADFSKMPRKNLSSLDTPPRT